MKATISEILLVGILFFGIASAQVCSPIGQLCTRTTDCCKGCCEAHVCVERPFSCSTDLIKQPGHSSCIGYYCPVGQICYLRDVCPPENSCPRQPSCRRYDIKFNHSDMHERNSKERALAGPLYAYITVAILAMSLMYSAFF